jgi:N-acetylneuraminic acid mutarotase
MLRLALVLFAAAPAVAQLPPLPVGVSSLGAVAADGHLYVYGGHAGKTHSYDTSSVLGTFHRLKLAPGAAWEELPGGPIAQGMNLVAHKGTVIRVGGMQPRNAPGRPADNVSLADVARYEPAARRWVNLPPLPAGRSSHDAVVVGDTLVVVGGWQSRGAGQPPLWHDTALTLDMADSQAKWKAIPQPFQRRALTAAVLGDRVYVIAGLDSKGASHLTVNILDPKAGTWATGPDILGNDRVGFSPAAAVLNGTLYVSTSDGHLHRLAGNEWKPAGTTTKRMVHRLVPDGPAVLLIGGAVRGEGNAAAVERVVPKLD